MSDMKCPICGQELLKEGCIYEDGTNEILWLRCDNCKIKGSDPRLWEELINTKSRYTNLSDVFRRQLETNEWLTDEANKMRNELIRERLLLKNLLTVLDGNDKIDVEKAINQIDELTNIKE